MIRFSELLGHDAVELGTAITVGKVTGIVLERDRIVSVELSAGVVPSTAVHGFDGDVLTFDPLLAVGSPKSLNEVIDPRGLKLLDMHGDCVGTIDDLIISPTGIIEAIELGDGHTVPGVRLRAVGNYAAILTVAPAPA